MESELDMAYVPISVWSSTPSELGIYRSRTQVHGRRCMHNRIEAIRICRQVSCRTYPIHCRFLSYVIQNLLNPIQQFHLKCVSCCRDFHLARTEALHVWHGAMGWCNHVHRHTCSSNLLISSTGGTRSWSPTQLSLNFDLVRPLGLLQTDAVGGTTPLGWRAPRLCVPRRIVVPREGCVKRFRCSLYWSFGQNMENCPMLVRVNEGWTEISFLAPAA